MKKNKGRKKTGSQAFGKFLHGIRKKNNFTGKQLSALSGVHQTHISKIEHGVHTTDFLVVKKMSKALKAPELMEVYLQEQHPNIHDYHLAQLKNIFKLAKTLKENDIDFPTWYKKFTKGDYTTPHQ